MAISNTNSNFMRFEIDLVNSALTISHIHAQTKYQSILILVLHRTTMLMKLVRNLPN